MKYYIIAGEASGDLHGAGLMRHLTVEDPAAEFRVWGGDLMEQQRGTLVKHYRDLAFMGFVEVISNLGTILKNIRLCKRDILAWKPDVLILIDYPGFNLRIASFAACHKIPVYYYISPQVWAWKKSRVKQIKKYVDRMFVILPFEKDFYKKYGVEVDYVGHPLLDALQRERVNFHNPADFRAMHNLDRRLIIAVLPGSRKQEIKRLLPLLLSAADAFPQYQFVVAGAPSVPAEFYEQAARGAEYKIIFGATHDLLHNAWAGLITSGTATLETALLDVPQVVCYSGNALSFEIAKRIVDIKYISLVNLIMDRPVVKELIQSELTQGNIVKELKMLLDHSQRKTMLEAYKSLREKLGNAGASSRAAKLMVESLKSPKK
ncbi:MAG TPA: lipid-A-disaccharide synthase [Bacteroidales bacterium]|nr:lipid-A-disaccharide synthase [Bacteroidales bacterium]